MRDLTPDIDRISEIVAFPHVFAEIQSEILKDNAASVRVAQLVKLDAALTVQVLRAANSPYYGLRWEVTTVSQAVALLGFEEVGHLALMFHLRQQLFKLNNQQVNFLNELWKHSLSTAIVAQSLASKFGVNPSGKAFTAGLLHDIGKIVLAQYYPVYLDEIRQMTAEDGTADIGAEEMLIGIAHPAIGAHLCEKWMLPEELVDVIRTHHRTDPPERSALLTAAVRFSDLLCELLHLGIGEQRLPLSLDADVSWKILQEQLPSLRDARVEEVNLELEKELGRRMDLLDIT